MGKLVSLVLDTLPQNMMEANEVKAFDESEKRDYNTVLEDLAKGEAQYYVSYIFEGTGSGKKVFKIVTEAVTSDNIESMIRKNVGIKVSPL